MFFSKNFTAVSRVFYGVAFPSFWKPGCWVVISSCFSFRERLTSDLDVEVLQNLSLGLLSTNPPEWVTLKRFCLVVFLLEKTKT